MPLSMSSTDSTSERPNDRHQSLAVGASRPVGVSVSASTTHLRVTSAERNFFLSPTT